MNNIGISILLVVVGLIIGLAVSYLINHLREKGVSKKADAMINQAKKEIVKAENGFKYV